MPPQDPTWHMDTDASSHLNFNTSNLSTIFYKRLFPSVHIGDGKSIPVTNTGHRIIHFHHRPLHFHNVLVTPNIIKNLIYVRQFTRDNNCTIEFEAFGFSVNDYLTRHILFRYGSSGDLYPVTKPSTPPIAFLSTSASTWHQRLGHPGDQVLCSLVSSHFISCNKEKSSHICHACQLGKHVKLLFHSSDSIVEHCFDIIYSDLWTSPIISSGGFKYYVLFLDLFSHYLWIYPFRSKSDMFDKFLHFRNYPKNQFKYEIKSFQCDHGGEFDNNLLHTLFAKHGIQLKFSCPKTSQQNGKAERMIRTINNIIRNLLFQAHLPPTFWVEALYMATYQLNRLPSTTIHNEIPYSCLFNKPPDYFRLRIFGCICYPHLHSPHKLVPLATPCIFLGYPAYHRGFRCLDLETNKIILSRHVTFDKTQFPYYYMTSSSPSSYTFLDPTPSSLLNTLASAPIPLPTHETTQSNTPHDLTPQGPTPIDPSPSPQSTLPTSTVNYHHQLLIFQIPCQTLKLYTNPLDPNWRNAMYDEYNALVKNSTWLLVAKPTGVNMVCSMWLFKHKLHADGTLSRYKARLVTNGSSQQLGVDFDETFSLVVKPAPFVRSLALTCLVSDPYTNLMLRMLFLTGSQAAYLLIYMDDIILTASCPVLLQQIIGSLNNEFDMTGLGALNYFLGIFADRTPTGGLQYLTFTRPDLSYAVQHICLYMHDPREPHLAALKRILRYVQGTLDLGLHLYASTSGYCVFLGDNLLSWSAKRQHSLSRSSAEAEYRGVANVVAETAWLRNLLRELHSPLSTATLVYCDNVSVVYMSANLVQHQRTKHIEIDIHFVRDIVTAGQVRVLHVPSHFQYADIFTKGQPFALFEEFQSSLSVRPPPAPTAVAY
nr:retrovirus-related Pol polyprotein from transposon TNT 1-94 [Tanacetum cinerariifolium]